MMYLSWSLHHPSYQSSVDCEVPVKLTLTVAILLTGCFLVGFPLERAKSSSAYPANDQSAILVGAGDIADCKDLAGAEATAKLLVQLPGTVMAVGDLAYPDGSKENFVCYDKTWGRAKFRTRPAPGNHEFHAAGATPYFDYFGATAGDPKSGYYSYELGTWHIIVMNSECKDLTVKPLFQALYDAHADVVVGGHDHDYERFAPQNPDGTADPARGVREFVVGTGGKNHRPFGESKPNSEVRDATAFGVLKLTLKPKSYDWQFIPEAGKSFVDSGASACH